MSIASFLPRRKSAPAIPLSQRDADSPAPAGARRPSPDADPSADDAATLSAVFAALNDVSDSPALTVQPPVLPPEQTSAIAPDAQPVAEPSPGVPEATMPSAQDAAGLPEETPPAPPVPSLPSDDAVEKVMADSLPDLPHGRPDAAPRSRVPLRLRLIRLASAVSDLRQSLARTDPFVLATLAPVPLIAAALVLGGWVALVAFAALTLLTFAFDELSGQTGSEAPAKAGGASEAQRLPVILAAAHGLLLALGIFALSGGVGHGFFGWLLAFLSLGLWLGQVSNSNAHELIHSADARLRSIGGAIFCSLLFGHHISAHRLVHHRFVATPDDPNSADAGESFWAFLPRAWAGSFVAGFEMERALMRPRFGRKARRLHPYVLQIGTSALILVLIGVTAGVPGVFVWLLLCAHAQLQLLLSDYVQHYGLVRGKTPAGRIEPVGPRHAWNAPHVFSGLVMLNAPRHSDHHQRPDRSYSQLGLAAGVPMLPHSLPVMATAALIPSLWRRIMDPRVAAETRRRLAATGPAIADGLSHSLVQAKSRARPI